MIRPSACQPQADQFPALSGRHGDRQSYTISWATIADLVPSVIYKVKAHPYRENQIPTLLGAEGNRVAPRCKPRQSTMCRRTAVLVPARLVPIESAALQLQPPFASRPSAGRQLRGTGFNAGSVRAASVARWILTCREEVGRKRKAGSELPDKKQSAQGFAADAVAPGALCRVEGGVR